jgi:hypothetical protein
MSDVVWNNEYHAEPTDMITLPINHTIASYADIIPCMFFTNEVMIKSSKDELDYMAIKIALKVNRDSLKEFQVDCDWSEQSKDNYFYFIKSLKSNLNSNTILSATIRLFQYKYPNKAGIPPADRGMLMLYNFTNPKKYDGKNPIFEIEEAKKYINNTAYKLPLDFAIAHFKWNILYDIDNTFIGYINETDAERLIQSSTANNNNSLYIINEDISIDGYFIRKGQKLALFQTDSSTIKQSYELIKSFENSEEYTISIFELNDNTIKYLMSNESIFNKNNR